MMNQNFKIFITANVDCLYIDCVTGDRPTYAQIADWRKILNRLASFLRSIDYLVLEMLRRLVITATRHLLEHLVASYNVTEEEEEKVKKNFPLSFKMSKRFLFSSSLCYKGILEMAT